VIEESNIEHLLTRRELSARCLALGLSLPPMSGMLTALATKSAVAGTLEVARRRPRPAPNLRVTFELLDAQSDDLGHGRFDAAFSRFGVMFFSDPVAGFTNIRESLKPSGRLVFVCWRRLGVLSQEW
jgi:SAM-dependent methyltransferase